MTKKSTEWLTLEDLKFKVKACHSKRWFEVTCPDGDEGVLLRQAANIWHFFSKECQATASGHTPLKALEGCEQLNRNLGKSTETCR